MNERAADLGISFNDALRLVGARLGDRALVGPRMAQIDLTDQCNNNCIGCWARSPFLHAHDDYDRLAKGELPLEFVVDLLDQLVELDVEQLFLGGGGEPLCHPQVLEVIRQAKRRGLAVTLNTNLTLADAALLRELAEIGLDELIVSLWAGTATTYARIHPNKSPASFERICATLLDLKRLKDAGRARLPLVKIYNVLCAINCDEIGPMVRTAAKLGAEQMELAVFDPIPGRTGHLILDPQQLARVRSEVEALDPPAGLSVPRELLLKRLANVDAAKGVYDNGHIGSTPCYAGWFYVRITTTGQVHSCLKSHRAPVGETAQRPLRQAWYGEGQDEFRRNTLKLDYANPYLRRIGHDINFALPGCYRICDNLGMNLAIQQQAEGLGELALGMLEQMEQTARRGGEFATRQALQGIYAHFAQVAHNGATPKITVSPDDPLERALSDASVVPELAGLAEAARGASEQGTDQPELLAGLGAILGRAYVGPHTLHLDLSNRCASDCRYCWFHSPLSAQRTDPYRLHGAGADALLDERVFRRLLDDLQRLGLPGDVVLSGKGEPLLHPAALDMLAELAGRGAFTTLLTGGLPLLATAEGLVRHGLSRLYVSLSAPDVATYAALHNSPDPGRDFEKIVEGIRAVAAARRSAGRAKPELVLANVLCAANADKLLQMAAQAAELGVDFIRLQLLAVEPYNAELRLRPEQVSKLRRDLPAALRLLDQAGVQLMDNLGQQLDGMDEASGDWSAGRFKREPCLNGWYFSRVWADGKVSFCCAPRIVGDLNRTSFYELWTGEFYERCRRAARRMPELGDLPMLDGTPLYGPQCERCPNYEMNSAMRRILRQHGLERWLDAAIAAERRK